MTDAPILNRPPRPRSPLAAGDFAVLAIVIAVFLVVVALGCAVLWDALNPSEWTADGWAAAGAWFAGAATVGAVWVALRQISATRFEGKVALDKAERLHQRQVNEEILRTDLAVTVALLTTLSKFTNAMYRADHHFDRFQWSVNPDNPGRILTRSEEDSQQLWETNNEHREVIKAHLVALQAASYAVRVPALRAALDEAVELTELAGKQMHTWGIQTMSRLDPLTPMLDDVKALYLPVDNGFGALPALAHRSEARIHDALKGIHQADPWADQNDASIAP